MERSKDYANLRLAGIEEKGVTEGMNFLPQKEVVTPIKEVNFR